MSRYRHGGGRDGNVAAGTLSVLKSAIPGVDTVVNLRPAFGGVDPESLESARTRAAMEIRTRYRAVTPDDFEFLCGEASPRVARAVCLPPGEDGMVHVHILPAVAPADRQLTVDEVTPDEELMTEVAEYLDERRVIGMSVQLLPVKLRGVSVVVNLQASQNADLERVEQDVAYALYTYLNPLVGGSSEGIGEGWEFGRALNQGELYGIVRKIAGVEFIKILRVYETDLATGKQDPKPAGSYIEIAEDEVIASATHIIKAERAETMSSDRPRYVAQSRADEQARVLDDEPARPALRHRGPEGRLGARLPAPEHAEHLPGRATSACGSSSRSRRCSTRSSATLDVLDRYFHPTLAPRDVLDLLAAWLGLTVDESWPDERLREALVPRGRALTAPRNRGRAEARARDRVPRAAPAGRGRRRRQLGDDRKRDEGSPAELCGLLRHTDPREDAARGGARDRADQAGARQLPAARQSAQEARRDLRHRNGRLPEVLDRQRRRRLLRQLRDLPALGSDAAPAGRQARRPQPGAARRARGSRCTG